MKREEVLNLIRERKIIVIVRGVAKDKIIPLAEAFYEGGIRLLEVTFDRTQKVTNAETGEILRALTERFGDRMAIGAGTVLTKEQVRITAEAGGSFIISPDVFDEVIQETRALQLVSIPGAMTPTEIRTAVRFGADMVKLFPAGTLGPDYAKAVLAPLQGVELLAVGGVNRDNMEAFLDSGITGFGICGSILDKAGLEVGDYRKITERAKTFVSMVEGE